MTPFENAFVRHCDVLCALNASNVVLRTTLAQLGHCPAKCEG